MLIEQLEMDNEEDIINVQLEQVGTGQTRTLIFRTEALHPMNQIIRRYHSVAPHRGKPARIDA